MCYSDFKGNRLGAIAKKLNAKAQRKSLRLIVTHNLFNAKVAKKAKKN